MANPVDGIMDTTSDPTQSPVVQLENDTILDLHAAMESFSHSAGLNGSLHGLTNTGETAGFGRIGDDNLLTDALQAPAATENGATPNSEGSGLIVDAGHTVSAAGDLVSGAGSDLANPDIAQDIANGSADELLGDGSGSMISAGVGQRGDAPIFNTGVLAAADDSNPISVSAGQGPSILDAHALNHGVPSDLLSGDNSGDHLVTGEAGASGDYTVANAGILSDADSRSPIAAVIGNGTNLADASVLQDSDAVETAGSVLDNVTGDPNAGDHLVSGDAGSPNGSPVADAGIFTDPDSESPLGVDVANGDNLANANLLSQSAGHIVTGTAGEASNSSIADAGVLTNPDSPSPIGAEVGDGHNLADANLLGHSDVLGFTNLQGAGSDALPNITPSVLGADNQAISLDGSDSADQSLVDVHTDGSPIVHVNDDPSSTLGLNHQPIL